MPWLDRPHLRRMLSRKLNILLPRKLRFRVYVLRHRQRSYGNYYSLIKRMSTGDPAAMSASLLTDLFAAVCDANEYYREVFSRCLPSNWRDLPIEGILSRLPTLTKQHLRDHFAPLHTVGEFPRTYRNTSGGSTGQPVVLTQDANYSSWSNATQGYYFREFLGVEMNDVKNVWLWGSERDLPSHRQGRARHRYPRVFWRNQTLLNTFHATTDQLWLDYIDFIERHRPYYVAGYASSLYQMAKIARRHNVRLYRPQFVYSAAETLRDFMREEIESQFNAKVFDFYGSREVGAIAGECRFNRHHVFTMNNVVEILPHCNEPGYATSSEGAFRPTQSTTLESQEAPEGRILVTNLHNLAFPLIRYEIGDTGAMGADPRSCPCGSRLPTLAKLTGRVSDHFVRRNGALVHGEFFTHLFYFRPWVESFRVDQLTYDRIRVQVARSGQVDEGDVAEITSKIRAAMDDECNVEWLYVDKIDPSPQGKHLYTRSYVLPDPASG